MKYVFCTYFLDFSKASSDEAWWNFFKDGEGVEGVEGHELKGLVGWLLDTLTNFCHLTRKDLVFGEAGFSFNNGFIFFLFSSTSFS